jgi:hypothetical protein
VTPRRARNSAECQPPRCTLRAFACLRAAHRALSRVLVVQPARVPILLPVPLRGLAAISRHAEASRAGQLAKLQWRFLASLHRTLRFLTHFSQPFCDHDVSCTQPCAQQAATPTRSCLLHTRLPPDGGGGAAWKAGGRELGRAAQLANSRPADRFVSSASPRAAAPGSL